MRFAQILSSHLTPEWRSHYIDYDALKVLLYQMVSIDWTKKDDDDECVNEVNTEIEVKFFAEIERQLDNVCSFYRAREAELSHQLHHLIEEVDVLTAVLSNPHTRKIRSTGRKRRDLIKAFCEFYFHLSLLQNFQQLNYTGFRKILKKYDKLAQTEKGGKFFKNGVSKAYFYTSKEVNRLLKVTEDTMIDRLENGNRGRAMAKLRVPPLGGDSSQWVSLFTGWSMGVIFVCCIIAAVALGFRLHWKPWDPSTGVLLGLRAGFILTIWFFAFAINTVGWRRAGVNNVLIFEVDPRNNLNYQKLFQIASFLGVIWCFGLLLFLFADWLHIPEYIGPIVSWTITIGILIVPIPLIYHKSRIWLLKELGRIALAPFFPVTFADFWIADQMNSLAILLLDMEYFICHLIYGQFANPDSLFQCGTVYYGIRPIIAMLPAWWRFAQCLRRYRDTREFHPHLVNAGKYSTSFFVVTFSSIASVLKDKDAEVQSTIYYIFFMIWIISALISSCYTFAWDIKMDWGFFEKGRIIREETIYSYKAYYIMAIIEDLLLRWVWTLTISVGEGGSKLLNDNLFKTVLAVLEVFRRFIWNFFRVENEHLNNCGQFRAVRDISVYPLNLNEVTITDTNQPAERVTKTFRRRASELLKFEDNPVTPFMPRYTVWRNSQILFPIQFSRIIPEQIDVNDDDKND